MSTARNIDRGLRLPSGAVVVVLSALLMCSQIVADAHGEVDCEHDRCGLCIASAGDSAMVADTAARVIPRRKRCVEPAVSADTHSVAPSIARFIRGPPAT